MTLALRAADSLVELAEKIASRAHSGQTRRGGEPYITHPRGMATWVGDDTELKVVAWLHDVLEDSTETPESLLQAGIPAHLVAAVVLLTREPGLPHEEYYRRIKNSRVATVVKIADMISNLADRPTHEQIRRYASGLLLLTEESPS